MTTKQLLVIYYTGTGRTKRMAEEIGKGAEQLGVKAEVKSVQECRFEDLAEADGIVIGSPTYFSNVAWQVKRLIDESITLYRKEHQLENKVGGCFTSSGTRRDGKDCISARVIAFKERVPRTTFQEHLKKAENKLVAALVPYIQLFNHAPIEKRQSLKISEIALGVK